ncbi:MAG: DUF58 domain-containing protein [Bacteroidia bacterium]|nr:MAG: DUF58 domain-containing protein [Bacteroidia bacterium]
METREELLKQVKTIEIKTRALSKQIFAGEYHSAFKGRGMTFSEVADYQYGDDIRSIDWNVTARYDKPYIKRFEEERELTVILMVDISLSTHFGTQTKSKRQLITELSAVLAFSAIRNNDKVGAILFTDRVEQFIPPRKGRKHILRIIGELLDSRPEGKKTDLKPALRYLTKVAKKKSVVFLISDFLDVDYEKSLQIASYKHDLTGIKIYDRREMHLPQVGLLKVKDIESGKTLWIDTNKKSIRKQFEKARQAEEEQMAKIFARTGTDYVRINTGEDYVKSMLDLFKKRLH